MKKRIISAVLILIMVLSLLPQGKAVRANAGEMEPGTEETEVRSMMLGTDGIEKGSLICFDSGNQWRVLSTDGNGGTYKDALGNAYTGRVLFLLSENARTAKKTIKFEEAWNRDDGDGQIYPTDWQYSDAQEWCKNFYRDEIWDYEHPAVLATTKDNASEPEALFGYNCFFGELIDDTIFFLSTREVYDYISTKNFSDTLKAYYDETAVTWLLRSSNSDRENSASVQVNGAVTYSGTGNAYAARPAFNLNSSAVLFSSAAEDGMDDAVDSSFTAVPFVAPTEWQLTIKDSSRTFQVEETALTAAQGTTKTIHYANAENSQYDYVSAMICDGNKILYYGKLKNIQQKEDENGTVDLTIPSELAAGDYTLKVFNEYDINDKSSDYSSDFEKIALTVTVNQFVTIGAQTGALTVGNTNNTATFSVATAGFTTKPTKEQYRIRWYTDKEGTKETTAPAGVTLTKTSDSLLTASVGKGAGKGTYYFRIIASDETSSPAQTAISEVTELKVQTRRNSVMLGIGDIDPRDHIFLGKNNDTVISWRVLSLNGNNGTYHDRTGTEFTGNPLFLISEEGLTAFHEQEGEKLAFEQAWDRDDLDGQENPNEWQNSDAQNWCKNTFLATAFGEKEKTVLLETSKNDAAYRHVTQNGSLDFGESKLIRDTVFFLSAEELNSFFITEADRVAKFKGTNSFWWLRSPDSYEKKPYAGVVYDDGELSSSVVYVALSARPAINLNPSAILLSSAAENGKQDEADSSLSPVEALTTGDWKLTVKDSESHQLNTATAADSLTAGGIVSVAYTGASIGKTLSAVIVDSFGYVRYYGSLISNIPAADGTVDISLPSDFEKSTEKLLLFTETKNGNHQTDYASDFVEVKENVISVKTAAGTTYYTSFEDGWNYAADHEAQQGASFENPVVVTLFEDWIAEDHLDPTIKKSFGTDDSFDHGLDYAFGDGCSYKSGPIVVPNGAFIAIDLNGKTINRALTKEDNVELGNVIYNSGTLIINDSSAIGESIGTGTITGGYSCGEEWPGGIVNYGSLYINGGSITENVGEAGGGVGILKSSGLLKITNGRITGNTAMIKGGGIDFSLGSLEVAEKAYISDNHRGTDSNAADYADNIFLAEGRKISIGTLLDGANISICTEKEPSDSAPITISSANSVDYSEYFHSDRSGFTVDYDSTAQTLKLGKIPPAVLSFTDSEEFDIPEGTIGTLIAAVNVSGSAIGGTVPYTFSLADAPEWLNINSETGEITGTRPATEAAAVSITVKVKDSGTPAQEKTIEILVGAVTAEEVSEPEVEFLDLTANGTAKESDTTELTITLGEGAAVTGSAITAENITVTGAKKGALTGSGTTYTLAVSDITAGEGETVTVSLYREGYIFTPESKTVVIHRAEEPSHTHTLTHNKKVDATCTTEGTIEYWSCSCGQKFQDEAGILPVTDLTIPKKEHAYGTEWEKDSTGHWHVCSCGAKTEKEPHTPGEWITETPATKTAKGTKYKECTVCHQRTETGEIPVLTHTHTLTHNKKVDATCTSEGTIEYWSCSCGQRFQDEAGILPVTDLTIPKKEHAYGTEWEKDSTGHWHVCSCGAKTEKEQHTPGEWITETPATETAKGTKYKECTVCHQRTETAEIPVVPGSEITPSIPTPELTPELTPKPTTPTPDPTTPTPELTPKPTTPTPELTPELTPDPTTPTPVPKPTPGVVKEEVKKDDKAPETKMENTAEELKNSILTKEELLRVENGEKASVSLEVKDISESVSEEEKELIEQELGDNTIGLYLDLSLFVQVGADPSREIRETNGKVKISLQIPEKLRAEEDSVDRI